jgi:hypothetical protein
VFPVDNLPAGVNPRNRHQIAAFYTKQPSIAISVLLRAASLSRGRFPEERKRSPHTPRNGAPHVSVSRVYSVFRLPTLFSFQFPAPAHTTQEAGSPAYVRVVCLPAISAFQFSVFSTIAHIMHVLHYLSPLSPFGFYVCFRSVSSGLVQRTAHWVWRLRLGLPTPGLVGGSPHHAHSSCFLAGPGSRWASPVYGVPGVRMPAASRRADSQRVTGMPDNAGASITNRQQPAASAAVEAIY